ncbi:MAG: ECF transporter S component [Chloroflexi bacterium]|nr:ECF transporter S component [Chloroflexota bacterium]
MRQTLTAVIYTLSAIIGVAAFAYPFVLPQTAVSDAAHAADAPVLTMLLIIASLGVLLVEVQGQAVSAKVVAALGVLVAISGVLRFVEVILPIPGGFSPIFAPIILVGYVFGARFGFLMGTMTMLASALVTGMVGPWLPYQMFIAGWVGLTAGWLPHVSQSRWQMALLVVFGFGWGLLFGAIMNLYFWPFVTDGRATSWQPGNGLGDGFSRYTAFYLITSLVWDLGRALGNAAFILVLGMPTVRALARFRDRFQFTANSQPLKAERLTR